MSQHYRSSNRACKSATED